MTFPFPVIPAAAGIKKITFASANSSATPGSSFTFSGQTIGRGKYLVIGAYGASSSSRTWGGVTVNGNAASVVVASALALGFAGIAIIAHPGVATATIVASASGASDRAAIVVWTIDNISSATPVVTGGSMTTSGPLVWCAVAGNNGTGSLTATWSQGNEDVDTTWDGGRTYTGASALDANGFSAETITCTMSGSTTNPAIAVAGWR